VVVPTHNRADLVPRAIASVQAQTYTNWEILAVDDGSSDDTPEVLARCAEGEPRIKPQRTEGLGVSGARNVGIDAAVGDVLVYLDDDNVFDPMWFKAIVWAFQQRPDVDVLYGARIIDDIRRVMHAGSGSMPYLQFERFSREFLERDNMADIGVIAHRSKLPEARFDPRLDAHADWDFFLNITTDRVPLELPAIALYYTSDSANRLSDGDRSDAEIIRARLRSGTS
jgi:glycosyltransferase involved in cell wall biosynthesis